MFSTLKRVFNRGAAQPLAAPSLVEVAEGVSKKEKGSTANKHVTAFLDYYCTFPDPNYAVLLSGPWGSGKTWFIKRYMEADAAKAENFLYVSLYGVQSPKDIEAQLYALLHPFLASKGVKVAKTLLTGIVQAAVKVDFNADGKEDATVTAKVPSEDLLKSLTVGRDRILVVDDLERCSMAVPDVLGYINQFVEHGGVHAIVLANLEELEKKDEKYKRINEKLIGRSLRIEPDIDAALGQFLSDMPSNAPRDIAKRNVDLIKRVYRASETHNLRLLRHGLVDFDWICKVIDGTALESEPLMTNFLGLFLAHFVEVKSGALPVEKISDFREGIGNYLKFREARTEHPDKEYFDLRSKYSVLNLHDDTVGPEIWKQFFGTGAIAADDLNACLLHSKYLKSEKQPNWVKLWHGTDLDDGDFEQVLEEVEREWDLHTYESLGVVTHVAGLLFRYAKSGICKRTEGEILEEAKAHVERLLKEQKIEIPMPNSLSPTPFQRDSFEGLGFAGTEEASFREFLAFIDRRVEQEMSARRPTQAARLLELLKSDPSAFMRQLLLNNEPDNYFYKTPILHLLDIDAVVRTLMEIPPDSRRTFAYAIKGRYEMHQFNEHLVVELDWLKRLKGRLLEEVDRRRGKVSSTLLESIVDDYVSEAIERLEEAAPSTGSQRTIEPEGANETSDSTAELPSEGPSGHD